MDLARRKSSPKPRGDAYLVYRLPRRSSTPRAGEGKSDSARSSAREGLRLLRLARKVSKNSRTRDEQRQREWKIQHLKNNQLSRSVAGNTTAPSRAFNRLCFIPPAQAAISDA